MMKSTIFIVLTGIFLLSACASQQDIITLDSRLAYLELELDRLRSKNMEQEQDLTQKNKNLRSQSASLRAQLDEIRSAIQQLNGQLESVEFQIRKNQQTLTAADQQALAATEAMRALILKNEQRIQNLEGYLNLEKGTAGAAKTPSVPKAGQMDPKTMSATQLYDAAKAAFDKGDFDLARDRFQQLLKRYPNTPNADNAQFWIGEIYYREKWYEKAILEYQKVIENYPKGNKVKDALLKQGYSFFNMGDNSSARLILKELIKKYPNSNQAGIAKQKLDQM